MPLACWLMLPSPSARLCARRFAGAVTVGDISGCVLIIICPVLIGMHGTRVRAPCRAGDRTPCPVDERCFRSLLVSWYEIKRENERRPGVLAVGQAVAAVSVRAPCPVAIRSRGEYSDTVATRRRLQVMSPTSSRCSTPRCCHECSASALRLPYSAMRYFSATLPLLLWVPLPSSATVDACGSCPSHPPSASTACSRRICSVTRPLFTAQIRAK